MSTTATANLQDLIDGIFRGDGNVKGLLNTLFYPWASPYFIIAGAKGSLQLRIGITVNAFFTIPCMVTEVNAVTEHNGTVNFDFNVRFAASAGGAIYARPEGV